MVNQHKIIPLGRLACVVVDIDGIRTTTDIEVIEIIDDNNPYPTLLGIDWEFDHLAIINLKKRWMIFEGNDIRVIAPLDPLERGRCNEPMKEEYDLQDIDTINNMIEKK